MKDKKLQYKVTLDTVGKKYIQEGETIDEALSKIPLTWNQVTNKGVITVFNGKDSYEHLFYTLPLRRIFANKLTRMMWAKRLKLLLEAGKKTNKIEKLEI